MTVRAIYFSVLGFSGLFAMRFKVMFGSFFSLVSNLSTITFLLLAVCYLGLSFQTMWLSFAVYKFIGAYGAR